MLNDRKFDRKRIRWWRAGVSSPATAQNRLPQAGAARPPEGVACTCGFTVMGKQGDDEGQQNAAYTKGKSLIWEVGAESLVCRV